MWYYQCTINGTKTRTFLAFCQATATQLAPLCCRHLAKTLLFFEVFCDLDLENTPTISNYLQLQQPWNAMKPLRISSCAFICFTLFTGFATARPAAWSNLGMFPDAEDPGISTTLPRGPWHPTWEPQILRTPRSCLGKRSDPHPWGRCVAHGKSFFGGELRWTFERFHIISQISNDLHGSAWSFPKHWETNNSKWLSLFEECQFLLL